MWGSFIAVFTKEIKHVRRDRGTLAMFFMIPIMQLTLFGFLDTNVRDLPIAVVDQDSSRESRELIDGLRATRTFEVVKITNNPDEAREMIAAGTARAAVIIPPDYHD